MVAELTNLEEVKVFIASSGAKILDFSAVWCGPCKVLGPHLEALEAKFQGTILVAKVDVNMVPEAATMFKVASIPCLVVFNHEGHEIDREVGFRGLDKLENLFIRHTQV